MQDKSRNIPWLIFPELPQTLQEKIRPKKQFTKEEQERFERMELSIFPVKYRGAIWRGRDEDRGASAPELPPYTNRGVKSNKTFEPLEGFEIQAIGFKGKFNYIVTPLPDSSVGSISFIDWINITFKKSKNQKYVNGEVAKNDYDYIMCLSKDIYEIFGISVTRQRLNGQFLYEKSYEIGDSNEGVVCIGGQNDSVLISMRGQGLIASKRGWEKRLYDYLQGIPDSSITRIDLASDSFQSEITVDDYFDMYKSGLFVPQRGRPPEVEQRGNWHKPNDKGRTLYIGSRTSAKYLRIYEKGKQLGGQFADNFPEWIRVELELKKAKDYEIPLEILLKPGQYLAGAYPALSHICEEQDVIQTQKNEVKTTVDRSVSIFREQFGKYLYTFIELFGIEETIEKLTDGKKEIPKKLDFSTYEKYTESDFFHTQNTLLEIMT